MIIKSHIRGGYRAAADYLKEQGLNEITRLVEISDPSAKNLDDAFHNMWVVASNTRCTKPLHHISINPMKDERLTDKQVLAIVQRCEEKYGYKLFHHQRVIVEHVKDGRQHFHVIWNRVSLMAGTPVWPGHHWNKSKQVCREMEKELGLRRPTPKRTKRILKRPLGNSSAIKISGPSVKSRPPKPLHLPVQRRQAYRPMPIINRRRRRKDENIPDSEKMPFRRPEWDSAELLAWAWQHGRVDILAQFGIYLSPDYFDP